MEDKKFYYGYIIEKNEIRFIAIQIIGDRFYGDSYPYKLGGELDLTAIEELLLKRNEQIFELERKMRDKINHPFPGTGTEEKLLAEKERCYHYFRSFDELKEHFLEQSFIRQQNDTNRI